MGGFKADDQRLPEPRPRTWGRMPFDHVHEQQQQAALALRERPSLGSDVQQRAERIVVPEMPQVEQDEARRNSPGVGKDRVGSRRPLPFQRVSGQRCKTEVAMSARPSVGNGACANQERPLVSGMRSDASVGRHQKNAADRRGPERQVRLDLLRQQRLSPDMGMRSWPSMGSDTEQCAKRNLVPDMREENPEASLSGHHPGLARVGRKSRGQMPLQVLRGHQHEALVGMLPWAPLEGRPGQRQTRQLVSDMRAGSPSKFYRGRSVAGGRQGRRMPFRRLRGQPKQAPLGMQKRTSMEDDLQRGRPGDMVSRVCAGKSGDGRNHFRQNTGAGQRARGRLPFRGVLGIPDQAPLAMRAWARLGNLSGNNIVRALVPQVLPHRAAGHP